MALRRLSGYGLVAVTAYVTEDALKDAVIYHKCKDMIAERSANHTQLLSLLGANSLQDCTLGPWYDSSVKWTHGGAISIVTIPARGPQRSSDVVIKVVRKDSGIWWPLFYTLTGGQWEPIVMEAIVGMGPGGLLRTLSLLDTEDGLLGTDVAAMKKPFTLQKGVHP